MIKIKILELHLVCGSDLVPGVVDGVLHGGDGDLPQEQLQASLAGFGRIHKGAEQKPAKMGVINNFADLHRVNCFNCFTDPQRANTAWAIREVLFGLCRLDIPLCRINPI